MAKRVNVSVKVLTDEEIEEKGMPKDWWNYTVNPVTGFSTHRSAYGRNGNKKFELNKYGESNNFTSTRVNGKVQRIFSD